MGVSYLGFYEGYSGREGSSIGEVGDKLVLNTGATEAAESLAKVLLKVGAAAAALPHPVFRREQLFVDEWRKSVRDAMIYLRRHELGMIGILLLVVAALVMLLQVGSCSRSALAPEYFEMRVAVQEEEGRFDGHFDDEVEVTSRRLRTNDRNVDQRKNDYKP